MKHGYVHVLETALARLHTRRRHYPLTFGLGAAVALLASAGAAVGVAHWNPEETPPPVRTVVEAVTPHTVIADDTTATASALALYRSDTTRSSDTADSLLQRLNVFDAAAAAFLRSNPMVQSMLLGRAGRNVTVRTDVQQALQSLTARWNTGDASTFQRLHMERDGASFSARLDTLPLQISTRMASGTIQTSLFAATDDARLPDTVAVQLAEIFSADIDFHTALRKGDRFTVVYESLEGDGEPLRTGRVLSAEFVNAGKAYQAMWFRDPAGETAGGYYTLQGESLRRTFLTSPLEFSRISSGFQMRFHPILQQWRAHLGVDYAATTGTPVRTVGEGVIDFAGVQHGFGNVVMVKHRSNQTTVYAHLSRIDVKKGQRVQQGQRVGAVGATGWATGPHLHFEFRVNGVHRDPLQIARQSATTPISAATRPAFMQAASAVRQQLDAGSRIGLARAE